MAGGRPKHWTDELIKEYKEKIIYEIMVNGYSLRKVCRLPDFPSKQVVLIWLRDDKEFQTQYTYACEERSEMIFEDMIEICDSTEDDIIVDQDGRELVNHNVINRDRLRVETRKWILAKMSPKKYGDKIDVTSKDEAIKTVNVSELITQFMDKKE